MTNAAIAVLVLRILGAFPALLSASELVSYFLDTAGYPFGTEIAGFQYNSPTHFVVSHLLVIFLYGSAYLPTNSLLRILALTTEIALFAAMIEYH